MNSTVKFVLGLILAGLIINMFIGILGSGPITSRNVSYDSFISSVRNNRVEIVTLEEIPDSLHLAITYKVYDGDTTFVTEGPPDSGLVGDLLKNGVIIRDIPYRPGMMALLGSLLPVLIIVGAWIYFMKKQEGMMMGGKGAAGYGKNKARRLDPLLNKIRFKDVAGIDEAKEEVGEIVEFLKAPQHYFKLRAKIPRGILMVGAPGTGKTLLAKAIAGEAKVPFFTISGSDFVEMFVGVGAARVREMFREAKLVSPSIIFIDELDSVGRKRGAGLGGGHDEREQTLNQLLVEMDGFEGNEAVILIAATNRPDVLDPALLRPGRFDRQVTIGLPDRKGREQILKVHSKDVPTDEDVDLSRLAQGTPGFTGADLANLINEGALTAGRARADSVSQEHLEKAKDKIWMGAEIKSRVMSQDELENTAYHECGHVIVAYRVENSDPLYKVSIIPRGRALGVTIQIPEEDRYSQDKDQILDSIAILMGGRIAEEIFKDHMTTGASNDFEKATDLARNMVTRWGMSEKLGTRVYGENDHDLFLGQSIQTHKNVSEETARIIDEEILQIVDTQYKRARKIIETDKETVERMARELLKKETLEATEIKEIIEA